MLLVSKTCSHGGANVGQASCECHLDLHSKADFVAMSVMASLQEGVAQGRRLAGGRQPSLANVVHALSTSWHLDKPGSVVQPTEVSLACRHHRTCKACVNMHAESKQGATMVHAGI